MAAVILPAEQLRLPEHLRPRHARSRPALRLVTDADAVAAPTVEVPEPAVAPDVVVPARRGPITMVARVLVALSVVAMLAAAVQPVLAARAESAAAAAAQRAATIPEVHVVAAGDTLWSIAASLQDEGDLRPLVHALGERAGGAELQIGQRIPLEGLLP